MTTILVVSSTFPQYPDDPRGAVILRHWERRARAGDRVRILAPRTTWVRGTIDSPCEVTRFRYAPAVASSVSGRHGILENLRERPWRALWLPSFVARMAAALEREIEALAPDRVVAHMLLPCGWVVARTCMRRGIPFDLHAHGTDADVVLRMPRWLRKRFAARLRAARKLFFPSHDKLLRMTAALDLEGPELGIETLADCVEPAPAVVHPRPREGILFLGRLIEQKGVDTLLRAASRLGPAVPVHVAGEGPALGALRSLAARLGVDARFHGFVHGRSKTELLLGAQVLCVPSRTTAAGLSEGAPLVVVEALAHGLEVVATRVGGIPELVGDDPVVTLVEPDDPEVLATALEKALAGARATSASETGELRADPSSGSPDGNHEHVVALLDVVDVVSRGA